jgi:hypothetical protein
MIRILTLIEDDYAKNRTADELQNLFAYHIEEKADIL